MSAARLHLSIVFALHLAALVALALALLGVRWLDPRLHPPALVLVDRSNSMPRAETDEAATAVADAIAASGARSRRIEFAGRTEPLEAASGSKPGASLDLNATDIEAAVAAALAEHRRGPLAALTIVSDGWQTVGDAAGALKRAREAGLPVLWQVIGSAPPVVRIHDVLAPERAFAGRPVRVSVALADDRTQNVNRSIAIELTAHGADGSTRSAQASADASGFATLEVPAMAGGPMLLDVTAKDAASGAILDRRTKAAAVDVVEAASILYVQGPSAAGSLAASLRAGGWRLDVLRSNQAGSRAGALSGYRAVVLDDVPIGAVDPRFWDALVAAVRDRGQGLLVLGGEHAFALGGYRGSLLETILPVRADPAALDAGAAVVFLVDKSGSMGESQGGSDRFQMARRAVLDAAQDLGERDALGVLLFDVSPRWLLRMTPAQAGKEALARDWPVSPHGGTRLVPALEAAVSQLEQAPGWRVIVLVTDGFLDDAPLDELRRRMARARIDLVVIGVGHEVNLGALRSLAAEGSGAVLRVDEAAELPVALRSALQKTRARVERGSIEIVATGELPFPFEGAKAWPPVAAYAVTRPRPEATTPVTARNGDPIISLRTAGVGRVVAITSGLGAWTPQWLRWSGWPQLAGGLGDWIGGASGKAAIGLDLRDAPAGLTIEAELKLATRRDGVEITIARSGDNGPRRLAAEWVAPGRLKATLAEAAPGVYTVRVATPQGSRQRTHVKRETVEEAGHGINPAVGLWQAEGLVEGWSPQALSRSLRAYRDGARIDRSLIGAALLLFIAGVVADRWRSRR